MLDLCDNGLDTLPAELGRLTKLKELYLSNNKLRKLPDAIQKMSSLEVLDIRNNDFYLLSKFILLSVVCLHVSSRDLDSDRLLTAFTLSLRSCTCSFEMSEAIRCPQQQVEVTPSTIAHAGLDLDGSVGRRQSVCSALLGFAFASNARRFTLCDF